jgi:hypothetical protein
MLALFCVYCVACWLAMWVITLNGLLPRTNWLWANVTAPISLPYLIYKISTIDPFKDQL